MTGLRAPACVVALLLLAPIAALAQVVRDAPPAPVPGGGTISGTVVRADDERQPVRGASVAAIGVSSGTMRITTSGEDGRFSIAELPADRYSVGAMKPPFIAAVAGAKRPARTGSAVVLAAGQHATDVTIKLHAGAAITGVIRDPTGEPGEYVTVALMKWRVRNGERVLATPLVTGTIETDDRGRYRFFGLAPGEYVVVAMRNAPRAAKVLAASDVDAALSSKTPGEPPPVEHSVPIYFPGTTRPSDAAIVTVGVGEEETGIDFQLDAAKPARLRVQLSTVDGQAFSNVNISANTIADSVAAQSSHGATSPRQENSFEFGNLRPDTLIVTANARVGAQTYRAAATVEVASGDDRTLSLVLRPAMTIAGRVVLDGAGTIQPAIVNHRVEIRGLGAVPTGEMQPSTTPADASGSFAFTGVIGGRYTIGGAGPGGWALQSVVVDGQDVTDRAITINPDTPPTQIVVTYTDRWQELSGRLLLASGAPINDYTIVVIPADPPLWPFGARRILTARPGTNGEFIFGGRGPATLPAGRYLLAAVTDIDSDDLADPSFLSALAQAAIAVVIQPGERKVQDLRVGSGTGVFSTVLAALGTGVPIR